MEIGILEWASISNGWFKCEETCHDQALYEQHHIPDHLLGLITGLTLKEEEIVMKELVSTATGEVI